MPRIEGVQVASGLYAPVLRVSVEVAGLEQEVFALVDSGADRAIFPGEILDAHPTVSYASLPLLQVPGVGAGGTFEIRECQGLIKWRQWEVCTTFQVAEPKKLQVPLLGREDFFKMFIVRFNWTKVPPYVEINPPGVSKSKKPKPKKAGGKRRH